MSVESDALVQKSHADISGEWRCCWSPTCGAGARVRRTQVEDARAGRRNKRPGRDLAAADRHRRPLLRGLQSGAAIAPTLSMLARGLGVAAYPVDRGNSARLWERSVQFIGQE
jgi:hypothetical protein